MHTQTLPDLYRFHIDPVICEALRLLEAGESLHAMAVIGRLDSDQTVVMPMDDCDSKNMEASARAVRTAAAVSAADFVFTIREAWILPPKLMPRYQQLLEKHGSVKAVPGAVEAVAFMLQTAAGTWAATPAVALKHPSKKRRKLSGPISFVKVEAVGRHADLLPQSAQAAGATVH
jgi:hypothetical protein